MADDIDIEEHDILENPRIKDILPHFDIKTEPEELDDDHEELAETYEEHKKENDDHTEHESPSFQLSNEYAYDKEMSEYGIQPVPGTYNNKIILGTKPCSKPIILGTKSNAEVESNLLNHMQRSCGTPSEDTLGMRTSEMPFLTPKLILGSKLTPAVTESQKRPERVLEDAVVLLEDWSERLDRSSCYCGECQTLFATRNALDAHNMIAHSFLVAMDVPETPDNDSPTSPQSDKDTRKYCNHCDTYFPNDNQLFEHLYKLYPSKSEELTYYPCPICTLCFKTSPGLKRHVILKHKTVPDHVEGVPFVPVCTLCKTSTPSVLKHTKHMYKKHYAVVSKIVKDYPTNIPAQNSQLQNKNTKDLVNENDIVKPKSKILEKNIVGKVKIGIFRCTKCNSRYSSMKSARSHVRLKHPKEYTIVHDGPKPANPVRAASSKMSDSRRLLFYLPKNLIFRCSRCSMHMLSGLGAVSHYAGTCNNLTQTSWTCTICSKRFNIRNRVLHLLQHEQSSNIETVTIRNDVYKRVLLKCQKCDVYFEERFLIKHSKEGCLGNTSSEKCLICDVNVMNHYRHSIYHSKSNFTKSDFIFIDDFLVTNHENVGRKKLRQSSPSPDLNTAERTLGPEATSSHKTAFAFQQSQHDDVKSNVTKRTYCNPQKIVKETGDEKVNSLALNTTSLNKLEPIKLKVTKNFLKRKLPSPSLEAKRVKSFAARYFYCTSCGLCSKSWKNKSYHINEYCLTQNNPRSQCTLCGFYFRSGSPFNIHLADHTNNFDLKDVQFVNIATAKQITPSLPKFPSCDQCKMHHLLKGDVHDCNDVRLTCEICQEAFDNAAYKLHYMHHEVLEPSGPSDSEVSKLLQKYDSLESTWNVLYNCLECNLSTDSYDHVVEHSQKHVNNIKLGVSVNHCGICTMNFEESCFKRHNLLHSDRIITKKSFRILNYKYEDLLTDNWLKIFSPLSETEMRQITSRSMYSTRFVKMTKILNGPPELTLYKCEACRSYVQPYCVQDHAQRCAGGGNKYPCPSCQIPFSSSAGLAEHHKIHANTHITSNSYRIISFNGKKDKDFNVKLINSKAKECNTTEFQKSKNKKKGEGIFKFYQCQNCKCCSPNNKFKHKHRCSKKTRECSLCGCVTTNKHRHHHRLWHEKNPHVTHENIIFIPLVRPTTSVAKELQLTYYKCYKCGVLQESKKDHMCVRKSDIRTCSRCQHSFSRQYIWKHATKHACSKNLVINVKPLFNRPLLNKGKMVQGVNKGTVFKCACGLHFTSEKTVETHRKICSENLNVPSIECNMCGLLFPADLLVSHLCKHHRNGKSDIVVKNVEGKPRVSNEEGIDKEVYKDSDEGDETNTVSKRAQDKKRFCLYKCAKCKIHFVTLTTFTKHKNNTGHRLKHKRSIVSCKICGLLFSKWVLAKHILHHHSGPEKNVAFKIITRECDCSAPIVSAEQTRASLEKRKSTRQGTDTDIFRVDYFHECWCGINFFTIRALMFHQMSVKDHKSVRRYPCDKCKLDFTKESLRKHKEMKCNAKCTKKSNNKLYRCAICKVHYLELASLNRHNLGNHDQDKLKCSDCNLEFVQDELSRHVFTHHKNMGLSLKDLVIIENCKEVAARTSNTQINYKVPEGIQMHSSAIEKQYNANVLFKCTPCDAHFLSCRSAIDHLRHGHPGLRFKDTCKQCGINFPKNVYNVHRTVHHVEKNLSLEDFTIYDIQAISKMAGSTVYRCLNCPKHFVSAPSFSIHAVEDSCDGKGPVFTSKCNECGLAFTSHVLPRHKAMHHGFGKQFSIETSLAVLKYSRNIHENSDSIDKTFSEIDVERKPSDGYDSKVTCSEERLDDSVLPQDNDQINVEVDEETEAAVDTSEAKSFKLKQEVETHVVYKCVTCRVCFSTAQSLDTHRNRNHTITCDVVSCHQCGLRFTRVSIANHIQIHHGEINRTINDFTVIDVTNVFNTDGYVVYKCGKCDVHYTYLKQLVNHIEGGHKDVNKKACIVCGLAFDKVFMKLHLHFQHAKKIKLEDFTIETIFPLGIGNVNSDSTVKATTSGLPDPVLHQITEGGNEIVAGAVTESEKCDSAGISVTVDNQSVDRSKLIESQNVKDINSSVSESVADEAFVNLKDKKKDSFKLYKCGECNVHFLNQNSCYKHTLNHVPMDAIEYIACKMCSLQFKIMSLTRHMRKHHQNDFKLVEVLVEEYLPKREGEKTPTINIYYAIDKLQSRLVSTTTDDDKTDDGQNSSVTESQIPTDTIVVQNNE